MAARTPAAIRLASVWDWSIASSLQRLDDRSVSPDDVAALWNADNARLLIVDKGSHVPVTDDGNHLRMIAPQNSHDPENHLLLGYVDKAPQFATGGQVTGPSANLREVMRFLPDAERDIATAAVALCNWHRNESFCPHCGNRNVIGQGGQLRRCPACGYENFPRTDPAVIVGIVDDDDRLLLGSKSNWGRRVSVFAGFVEAGESAEQAVHREMAEEVGATLRRVCYVASQPWPFPRSLMLGYIARADSARLQVNGTEIKYADWFTRDGLRREHSAENIALPSASSIAHRLIDGWLEHEFDGG